MNQPLVGHITAHLGGGVGRALVHLIAGDTAHRHEVISIETTRDGRHVAALRAAQTEIVQADAIGDIRSYVTRYDILQIEYWNNPDLLRILHELDGLAARWVLWSHISGLGSPRIPPELPAALSAVVFTTPLSLKYFDKAPGLSSTLHVVPSAVGLAAPSQKRYSDRGTHGLYLGALSPAKMHADYVFFLRRFVEIGFERNLISGEVTEDSDLPARLTRNGLGPFVETVGHVEDVAPTFEDARYFLYILNPTHYGTSENALIEAMSAGVVPIVLNNPVEAALVSEARGGYVIDSADGILALKDEINDEGKWQELSANCVDYVARTYSRTRIVERFRGVYDAALRGPKKAAHFAEVFGRTPGEWFLSNRADAPLWNGARHITRLVAEKDYAVAAATKGSLDHFCRAFPGDAALARWRATAKEVRDG